MNTRMKEKDLQQLSIIEEKLLQWITPKTVAIIATVTYFVSLIPLIWIGFYNYPSADDYSNGSWAHLTWMATHNVFATIWSAFQKGISDWLTWVGYYTCGMLTALPPSAFGEKYYVLATIIILTALTISTMYLLDTIFRKWLRFDKYLSLAIIMITLFIMVQCMMPEARVEAFYWYSGAVNYIFIFSLSNVFYGSLIRLAMEQIERKKKRRILATAILGFLMGGGNQMQMLNVAIVLLLAIIMISLQKKWKTSLSLIPAFVCFYAGMILNIVAPGNYVRAKDGFEMNPIKAILVSLHYGLEYCVNQWTTWPILLGFLVIGMLAWKLTVRSKFSFPCPIIVVLLAYGLTSAMMTPPLFVKGNIEAGRIQANTFLVYILFSVLSIVYVAGWFRNRCTIKQSRDAHEGSFSLNERRVIFIAAVVMLMGSGLAVIPNPHAYTFSSAITDLRNGSAQTYHQALVDRTELYYSGIQGVIEVESLPVEPDLLYFSDIATDAEDWENKGVARYLGVDGVVRKPKAK